ncbi:hypothetical protein QWI17_13100 [Gilvimarinus sp. SDUM040013]|uniref:Uncharacterized protein n=1 Tax=Gilvimarinus gilvus TaxID=3058038 RepID=A0ABU4RTT2_9GAMM|nr:hypothetical protein [Gilvimarinus sp. SDUM040013]MDO3386777.1 hypothetical protein [Gilvimarinus sp. SDUM040013]MDX6848293.1 hypothetical protein [Gilvimarinus sp. SDUM040013]
MSTHPVQIQKRRIVFTALSKFMQGDDLSKAFRLWEKQYSDKPVYALNEFVGKLSELSSSVGPRKEVIRTLLNLSQDPGAAALLPDPSPSSGISYEPATAKSEAEYPERLDKVFENFLVALEKVLPSDAFLQLRLNFLVRLGDMNLNPTLKARLRLWFDSDGGGKVFSVMCTSPEIRRVVNQLYVVMCELYGPMRADDTLEKCVAWLEAYHPQSVRDVRRFL